MSVEDKFTAAVNVIRSLPKNGSYQPSKELMLRFYAFFKQATIGRNNQPKPSFWDVVSRAKWQAWENLGDMPKEQAMQEYVNELKKIVETMAYTNPVADFVSSLDSFYESVSINDLEMAVGPLDRNNFLEKADTSSIVSTNECHSITDTDIDEDECFHDVMESTGELKKINVQKINQSIIRSNEYVDDMVSKNHIPISQQNGTSEIQLQYTNELLSEFQLQVRNTVSNMKYDLDHVKNEIAQMQLKLNEVLSKNQKPHRTPQKYRLYQMIFLIGWPIFVQLVFMWFQRRNRRKSQTN